MNKKICTLLFVLTLCVLGKEGQAVEKLLSPVERFFNDIDKTTSLKVEYDDNIFLVEDNEDSDVKQVFTQGLKYKKSFGDHFIKWDYTGTYSYYDEESLGVLSHTGNFAYSYRPFKNFSIGLGNTFNWQQDNKLATPIGDRLLALGYVQNTPNVQMKYQFNPRTILSTDLTYQDLDVRDSLNGTFIDHRRTTEIGKLSYMITDDNNLIGYIGFQGDQVMFRHTDLKDTTSTRGFGGLTKKFSNLMDITYEIGFKNTDFDSNHGDDSNVDHRISIDTNFSLYTKLGLSYSYNMKNPSLRSEYVQYASNMASINLTHTINPKTTLLLGYSYETQDFDSSDVLTGGAPLDRKTHIHTLSSAVNRKLNEWLALDFNYNFSKRDTSFAGEGYIDNKYALGLTARY